MSDRAGRKGEEEEISRCLTKQGRERQEEEEISCCPTGQGGRGRGEPALAAASAAHDCRLRSIEYDPLLHRTRPHRTARVSLT